MAVIHLAAVGALTIAASPMRHKMEGAMVSSLVHIYLTLLYQYMAGKHVLVGVVTIISCLPSVLLRCVGDGTVASFRACARDNQPYSDLIK